MLNERRQTWKVTCAWGQEPGQSRQGAECRAFLGLPAPRGADPTWVPSALPASSQKTGKLCGSYRLVCYCERSSGRFHGWIATGVPVWDSTWPWCCHARVCTRTRACGRLRLAETVFARDAGLQFPCDVCPADASIALTSLVLWDLSLLSAVPRRAELLGDLPARLRGLRCSSGELWLGVPLLRSHRAISVSLEGGVVGFGLKGVCYTNLSVCSYF